MILSVEIALLCLSFKRLRLEREQIIWISGILLDLEQLTSEFHIRKAFFKASGTRVSGRGAALLAIKSRWVQILNKTKDCKQQTKLRRRCGPERNLVGTIWQFYCRSEEKTYDNIGQNARRLVLGHSMAIAIEQIHVIVFTLVYLEYK